MRTFARFLFFVSTALAFALAQLPAHAQQGSIPPGIKDRLAVLVPEKVPDEVSPTPVDGLYQVRFGVEVFYLAENGRYMFTGDMRDMQTGMNLADIARRGERSKAMAALDEDGMIVFTPTAKPEHVVTVFTDIDCPYCVRLHERMADYNRNGIEIRYTAFPRAGIGSNSYMKAVMAWCADNPQVAIGDSKMGKVLDSKPCEAGHRNVREHYEVARSIGIRGTPALVLESGDLIPGFMPPEDLIAKLKEIGKS
ncbi:DsbC family protein [Thioalkalivibrio sp. HK1]|uniref:DsbC family protein n=1 Tax=Thioalkalivibrio sp. HK1 TaxID=1469245 RepID=UPI00057111B5|nr:DsbC family protein [Thioalkalivibrio sp. HK1]